MPQKAVTVSTCKIGIPIYHLRFHQPYYCFDKVSRWCCASISCSILV